MFERFADELRDDIMMLFFNTTVTVERDSGVGTWTLVGTFDASVQQPKSDRSDIDPEQARATEGEDTVFFLDADTDILEGMRLTWDGKVYRVVTSDQDRSIRGFARVAGTRYQSALPAIPMTFRREGPDGLYTVGTFDVRITLDLRGGYAVNPNLVNAGQTAEGTTQTGTLTGVGPEANALEVGDWFGYEGMPGRIATENRSDENHPRFGIVIERETA